jgi:phage terminase large subunit-like protein
VDPSLTGEDDLTGIVVVARDRNNHMWVLDDRSILSAGREACRAVWSVALEYKADLVVYEENLGKRYLAETLRDAYQEFLDADLFPPHTSAPMKPVHAKHGKKIRAEPVALRSEQGRLHIVGDLQKLEDEMVLYDPQSTRDSPDRMDALVHACLHLMAGERRQMAISGQSTYDFRLTQDLYNLDRLL